MFVQIGSPPKVFITLVTTEFAYFGVRQHVRRQNLFPAERFLAQVTLKRSYTGVLQLMCAQMMRQFKALRTQVTLKGPRISVTTCHVLP